MSTCEILDTFPSFLRLWNEIENSSLDVQINSWVERYMSLFPELLQKQLDDFANLNEDWRATASERIFPALPERLAAMQTARDNLLGVCSNIYGRCQQVVHFEQDLVCVIYVGLGCGAGWADEYNGKLAILFGLENIAEEGWQNQDSLEGLMAHELGHLVHFEWRKQTDRQDEDSPWWQLYTEGFAQYCEKIIVGKQSWHMRQSASNGYWNEWCEQNIGWLASEFLRRIDQGEDMRPFFGSWFDLRGHKQTGYFLGYELIKILLEKTSLRETALLTNMESHLRPLLIEMAT